MFGIRWRKRLFVACLPFAAACSSHLATQPVSVTPVAVAELPAPAPAPVVAPEQGPAQDPVLTLIAASEDHFRAGERELARGHFEGAKTEFNQAIDLLLESPYGGRTEPRIRDHFDRLVDRISTYEVKALAEGDGFAEKKSESASIDELLALTATVGMPIVPPGLQQAVQSDLQTAGHDIDIPLNQRVLAYIELFQGRLHDFIADGLQRGTKYLPMIQSVFRAEGLPLDLAYVPLIESAFKPNALSRAKARGVWQFMSGTATENGLHRDWYIDERSDPEKATVAAAKYLHTLVNMFDGDWHLALASYNGGPGRMQRAIKRAGVDDFWSLASTQKYLPRETREYVPMILAAIVVARNPSQYGFSVESSGPSAYEKVVLPRAVDLRRVAEWADTTIDEIQSLNPELRRWTTPVRATDYELKVPYGTSEQVTARLAETSGGEVASFKWYVAKRGDTLPIIAKKLQVSRNDLADANYMRVSAKIAVGQKLIVPREATTLIAANAERGVPVAEARQTVPETGTLARDTESNRVKVIYEVRQGDTLTSIARVFKTSVSAIRTWNPRLPDERLVAGQRLTVYRPGA